VKFTKAQGRNSGDPNTSCGNTLVNATALGAWLDEWATTFRGLVPEIKLLEQHLIALGLKPKVHGTFDSVGVDFLSGWFLPTKSGTVWIPKVARLLTKLGWRASPSLNKPWKREFCGTLQAYQTYSGIPFIRTYVKANLKFCDTTRAIKPRWFGVDHSDNFSMPTEPDVAMWNWFYQKYGVLQEDEAGLEKALNKATGLQYFCSWTPLEQMLSVDLA